ncbi:LuxR C-terminal-related transcriptional regulator [Epilithonimonas xixisoli]|uniref:Regulatory LuxR family protein n=1 Tax=Epilithonimonas xixisoli TaxID=1476462 RepID=A0A4R8IE71_9FLAO|nr:LuxR C-terminal-related transcriptional regulator [Epilithonimonas xixisoli]TDX83940.1 regulatory LuxR family protein [Epilithonimonas xixisoli]
MNLTASLSKREEEVAEVMAFTKDKTEASKRLFISAGTLSAHTFRIYDKLEINSKSELVIWWMVRKMGISKKAIPYFQYLGVLVISFGVMNDDNPIIRRQSFRHKYKCQKEYITSK